MQDHYVWPADVAELVFGGGNTDVVEGVDGQIEVFEALDIETYSSAAAVLAVIIRQYGMPWATKQPPTESALTPAAVL